jgi:hypothetical protein
MFSLAEASLWTGLVVTQSVALNYADSQISSPTPHILNINLQDIPGDVYAK